ncbi:MULTISPECIES: hypothetical protein [Streptomyces]|uniref:hypothetical protein n=1 Tax=Streptomyces scabiei TaxID=1930 RepID=UPI0004E7607B|nr:MULTISPECIES: hypothetical protein [Streptomyces]MBP5866908.1 hypothetical protein [Streptomyces sp. LBUM 1485]KFG05364.1 hypothetical protein IQ61_30725 [Streptomyces scabiei]MBP5917334.1 hypothetical protein [Streptomyces sp. LBUM 1486]MDX2538013.1 hypothetical protein [Streptomyces scabiei]MDX2798710.1 hypothetical protein [Streptomyces scabiei]
MTLPGFIAAAPVPPVPTLRRDGGAGDRLYAQLDTHCATLCSNLCADACRDVPPYEAGDCLNRCAEDCLTACLPLEPEPVTR